MKNLKTQFLLNPEIIFLNHGSFGACPRPVFSAYQEWQLRLERQPVKFLGRDILPYMETARTALAAYLNCRAADVIYFPNPTTAANMVARSLDLQPGDEILTTDHEYGAMDRTWDFICGQTGARYVRQPVPLPVTTPEAFVETFLQGLTARTRLIFISHITSQTALTFPVAEICRRAREAGLTTIVDGAHAPGQIPVDVQAIGADVYIGACHKWMMAPKGSAFLYAHPDIQPKFDPLVVSWGYDADSGFGTGNKFLDYHEWQGTRDMSAFLTVPAAIEFMDAHDWPRVRARCHRLAAETRARLNALTGLPPLCPDDPVWFTQFFAARLPESADPQVLKTRLYDEYRIEVPVYAWREQPFIRPSFQGYNTPEDADALVNALKEIL